MLRYYYWLERYGMFVLMALLFLGVLQRIMGPIVGVVYHLVLPGYMWLF
jgi:hypothetical protein